MAPPALAFLGFGGGIGSKIMAALNLAFLIQTGGQIVNFFRDRSLVKILRK